MCSEVEQILKRLVALEWLWSGRGIDFNRLVALEFLWSGRCGVFKCFVALECSEAAGALFLKRLVPPSGVGVVPAGVFVCLRIMLKPESLCRESESPREIVE